MRQQILNILAREFGAYVVKRCQNIPGSSSWLVSIQAKHTGKVFAHFFDATTEEQARSELVTWRDRSVERPFTGNRLRPAM